MQTINVDKKDGIVNIKNITKNFPLKKNFMSFSSKVDYVNAVENVSLIIYKGETIGIVGESGSGKTTLGKLILRVYKPTTGNVIYNGDDITNLDEAQLFPLRRKLQMVFQDPLSSLNPRMTVREILEEPMIIHAVGNSMERNKNVDELLDFVGLSQVIKNRYPHEFSGGQRQRIGIARALATKPEVVVCDEPVSSLDVSIQAQIINLLEQLQQQFKLTYVFVTHNMMMVRHISHRVGIMYMGQIVELMEGNVIIEKSLHPYTRALIHSIPSNSPVKKSHEQVLKGEIPSPLSVPPGCRFHTRCPLAEERCRVEIPVFEEKEKDHFVACHLVPKKP